MPRFRFTACLFTALLGSGAANAELSPLSCLLEPSHHIEISSQVPGVVERVKVERGQRVRKGQTLLVLKQGVERALLASVQAKHEFAVRKYERNSELLKKELLSEFEKDELMTEARLGQLAVDEARERLKLRTILSPIDGIVISRRVSVGEFVSDDPVMELVSLDPLYAEVVFAESNYGVLSEGMELNVELVGPVSGAYPGVVKIVDPIIDAASGTFGARVEIDNRQHQIPAGVKCRIAKPVVNPEAALPTPEA